MEGRYICFGNGVITKGSLFSLWRTSAAYLEKLTHSWSPWMLGTEWLCINVRNG